METILEVIEAVDQKLDSPDKWTKGAYARYADGSKCTEHDPSACCHCLIGAVISVSPHPNYQRLASDSGCDALNYLCSLLGIDPAIQDWNDHPSRTFADIKSLLKNAKESLQSNV